MAEIAKTPSLSEQYILKGDDEKVVVSTKPAQESEVETLVIAAPEDNNSFTNLLNSDYVENSRDDQNTNPPNSQNFQPPPNFQCPSHFQVPPNFQSSSQFPIPPNFQSQSNFSNYPFHPNSQFPMYPNQGFYNPPIPNQFMPGCQNPMMGGENSSTPINVQQDSIGESEISEFSTQEGVEHIVDDDAPTTDMNFAKRNTFWTIEEEEVFARAWIQITEDSVVGKCQKGKDFWRRIGEYFLKNSKTGIQRRPTQIKSHWHVTNQACTLFSNIMTRIINEHHSGWSDDRIKKTVRRLYLKQTKKHFKLEHMWKLLKRCPKWLESTSLSGAYTLSSEANTSVNFAESSRPMGQNAAKRKAKTKIVEEDEQETTGMTDVKKLQESKKLQDEMIELRRTIQLQILFKDTPGMTEVQKKRHEKACRKIAKDMDLDD